MEIKVQSLEELAYTATQMINAFPDDRLFAFYASMGAGKTTFIKALCNELGVTDNVSSPTFPIINEYITKKGSKVFHFDFYRLKNVQEAQDLGIEEYFATGAYCFIEWPENIGKLLPAECLRVSIEASGSERIVRISK